MLKIAAPLTLEARNSNRDLLVSHNISHFRPRSHQSTLAPVDKARRSDIDTGVKNGRKTGEMRWAAVGRSALWT
jgi:hypothetical protein